jgi:hypothetical protein
MIDLLFNLSSGDVIYDIETYPNIFTFYALHTITRQEWLFEISSRKNEIKFLLLFLQKMRDMNCRMVGFNNLNFDYPVVHYLYKNSEYITVSMIYEKAMSIINNYDDKFGHLIYEDSHLVKQIDLFKIHHFDNLARSTSLKVLEFNMRSHSVEGLPFKVGYDLNYDQMDTLIKYNRHDILETLKFYHLSEEKIKFREELSEKYGKNFLNHNDTKIGKDYFIMQLEKHSPGCCYRMVDGRRRVVQTNRTSIQLKDVILPYIKFTHPEFNRILTFFKSKTITETKGIFKDINCVVNGFKFDFGTGGIHGSISSEIIYANSDYMIEDCDVASYYPNLAIANNFYPAHLGSKFCSIYKEVYDQRKKYPKKSAENEMLKLALNGVYGDSNNQYSPFYDPQYTMSITINGQLLLCMLCDVLSQCKDIRIIQINTDGISLYYPKTLKEYVHQVMTWWQSMTNLTLENAEYNRVYIRDVNHYIAEYTDGTLKRKGVYEYKKELHQNHSALVVPMAVEAHLIRGEDIRTFIQNHNNILDFMLRTKLPKKFSLEWGGSTVQNVTRYYVSTEGDILEKIMPPTGTTGLYKRKNQILEEYYQEILREVGDTWDKRIHTDNKSKYEERKVSIHAGWTVQVCNDLTKHTDFSDVNYEFYIQESEKLVRLKESDVDVWG